MTSRWVASALRCIGIVRPPPMGLPAIPEAMRKDLEFQESRLAEASARHAAALTLAGRTFLHTEQSNTAVGATVRRVVDRMRDKSGDQDAS